MILDLHSHSIKSDDGRAKVENYCQWIRKRGLELDGLVLTEHRQFDRESDYAPLEQEYGLLILKGSEVETDYGHVLVFGVNEDLEAAFDFTAIDLPLETVIRASERCGAVAVPCHPGRPTVGLCAHYDVRGPVDGVRIVEVHNGGSRSGEDEAAVALAERYGYAGVGGSDAHLVSQIGSCATRFERPIANVEDLVAALREEKFEALTWK
jgi:predicted metal-dependent phosphoesterase TrpH